MMKRTALRYPLALFPLRGPAALEDWITVDGAWHHIAYVFDPRDVLPAVYVDGKPAARRSESALFDRCLSREEVGALYRAGSGTYHEKVREMGGRFLDLDPKGEGL